MRAVELLEEMEGIRDNSPLLSKEGSEKEKYQKLFDMLQKARSEFLKVSGIGKISPEYFKAAEIYNELIKKILDYEPGYNGFLRGFTYFYVP